MNYLILDNTDSTNSYAATHADALDDMTMVFAHRQQAGRGQRGNSWESEPGKNLTVTLIHKPAASETPMDIRQFRISEAVALAVVDTLAYFRIEAKVKWPNDVYVGNSKICGILIEHAIMGNQIANSRIGIGLNVNQRYFRSDAPNPASMVQILNSDEDIELPFVLNILSDNLERRLTDNADPHPEYCSALWRADNQPYLFNRPDTPDSVFSAKIANVKPNGILVLTTETGEQLEFKFKEVRHVLDMEYGELTIV